MYSNLAQQANTFTHNVRNEVVSATLGTNEYTYSYDPIGNRTTSTKNAEAKSYISNPLNQYITIQQEEQTVAPTYDADGNMLSSPSGWSFTWNAENRLVSASRGGVVVHYTYDAFGRMISKQITGAENKTITYTWDVFNIIKETENGIATYNIWGLDVDGTMRGAGGVGGLLAVAKSGNFYTPTYDANGNITEYIAADGNIVAQYQYSAFGEIISQSGMPFTHRFSTKPYCTTTGLIEYQFRKYDPALGSWLSRDPIEEAGGINLYAFCGNDGISTTDYVGNKVSSNSIDNNTNLTFVNIVSNEEPLDKNCWNMNCNISCIYFVFYLGDSFWTKLWAYKKSNNYLSHIAIALKKDENPIGFNPKGIKRETRTDIQLIYRCCFYDSDGSIYKSIEDKLNENFNNETQEWNVEFNGESWGTRYNNCAFFAYEIAQGKDDKAKEIFPDLTEHRTYMYFWRKYNRPEKTRIDIHNNKCCKVIYKNETWKGNLNAK